MKRWGSYLFRKVVAAIRNRLDPIFLGLLKLDAFRYQFCKYRWKFLRRGMRTMEETSAGVGNDVISYNLSAFSEPTAAFGMGKRMALLLYPAAAICRKRPDAKVLIVGPRTEDDIFWARSLGLYHARGLDLLSYSKLIDVGDMHKMPYANGTFDIILLGWVLAYSSDPAKAIAECMRVLKPHGFLGIGMEAMPREWYEANSHKRPNSIRSGADLRALIEGEVVFCHDPIEQDCGDIAMIFRCDGGAKNAAAEHVACFAAAEDSGGKHALNVS